jgi:CBS domain-containing protein
MRPDEPVTRIMTEAVVAIEVDRPVSEVLDCFMQYPIHHLPVVRHGRIVGMLSSADAMKLEFFMPRAAADTARFLDQRVTIERLMRSPVISATPETSITEAAERMVEAGVHALPVVDREERVLGLVTTTDVIRSLLRGPPRRAPAAPARHAGAPPGEEAPAQPRYHRKPDDGEYRTALRTAATLRAEGRDPRHLGRTLLYLDQRRARLEEVLALADQFLLAGQDEQTHALLLKAIHAAKRAEEHATGQARLPSPPG